MKNEGKRARRELLPTTKTFGWAQDRRTKDAVEAEVVRDIFQRVAGGASVGSVVRLLNDLGIAQVRGGAGWKHGTVAKILGNARYYGAVLEIDGSIREGVIGTWEHIIDRDLFEHARATLGARRAAQHRKPTNYYSTKHLLGGLIECAVCGSAMRSSSSTSKGSGESYALYRCTRNKDYSATPRAERLHKRTGSATPL